MSMSYFDSPKNRALWDVELKKLREEKTLRSMGKGKGSVSLDESEEKNRSIQADSPYRIRTSYKELVEEARLERLAKQEDRAQRKLSRVHEREMDAPSRTSDVSARMSNTPERTG